MTTDERLTAVENTQATTNERLTDVEETNSRIVDLLERVVELIEETRRESQQTRRIWIAFARHHGWPEDLEN